MKESNIEKAFRLIQDLKNLSLEIEEIEAFAKYAANNAISGKVSIEGGDLCETVTQKDTCKELELDSFERAIMSSFGIPSEKMISMKKGLFDPFERNSKPEKPKSRHLLTYVSETSILSILGCIMGERQAKQKAIISQLETLGVVL